MITMPLTVDSVNISSSQRLQCHKAGIVTLIYELEEPKLAKPKNYQLLAAVSDAEQKTRTGASSWL